MTVTFPPLASQFHIAAFVVPGVLIGGDNRAGESEDGDWRKGQKGGRQYQTCLPTHDISIHNNISIYFAQME